MSDGFDWGLRPRNGREPESREPKNEQPEAAEEDDPFAIFAPPEPASEPSPEPSLESQLKPQSEPKSEPAAASGPEAEPDLPPTEAMLTPLNPYRPAQPPEEPPAQPFVFEPPEPPAASAPEASPTDIDDIFGESAFREYDDGPLRAQIPLRAPQPRDAGPRPPHAPLTDAQRILLRVAGGLVAALVLVLIFVLGTHLPGLVPAAKPAAASTPKPTPVKSATVPAIGPVAPGSHAWDALLGGECITPYESAWQQKYTVVACTADHAGQLVAKGTLTDATFPGVGRLATRTAKLCASSKVLDYTAASEYPDLQVAASYPTTESEWTKGYRGYSCFVSRSSGDPMAGSLATS